MRRNYLRCVARLGIAATVRNNLVAAIQNMDATKMYISISLPYCDAEELQTLRDATTYISLDTQSQVSRTSLIISYCGVM